MPRAIVHLGGSTITLSAQIALAPAAPRRFRTTRSIVALILREMVTTYGRSPGGYLWAIVEPVAAIALLSFAFSLAFRAPSIGTSFPLFYATGYLPYMLFHDVSSRTASAIRFSRPLLNFGALTWFDVVAARYLLNAATHIAVAAIVLTGIFAVSGPSYPPDLPTLALAFCMAGSLAAGVGTLNCYIFMAFPAWERIWTVMTRPLFIISGVFFLFEDVPHEYRDLLWFNPLFHVTGMMREGFYPTYDATYASPAYSFGVGLGSMTVGLMLLSRRANGLIHK